MLSVDTPPLAFCRPKRGNLETENDDALQISPAHERYQVICVADGATEAFHSREWAQALVAALASDPEAYFQGDAQQVFWSRVDEARAVWTSQIDTRNVPWFAETKAAAGAFAAVAVLLFDHVAKTWSALAIGDVCIFHLREQALAQAWPLESADAFSYSPELVGVRQREADATSLLTTGEASYQDGDIFMVMSDAFAAWTLRCVEHDEPIWPTLLREDAPLPDLIAQWRTAGMKNDDVTLVMVRTGHEHDDDETVSAG